MASSVNFFFAAFEFLLPFSNRLYGVKGAYATILTLGAIGSIIGALIANKFKSSMEMLLFLLILTGVGVFMMGLPLPPLLTYSGNLVCELFMTIFNIHFFTQVQTKVEGDYLGRVLSYHFYPSHSLYAHRKRLDDLVTKCSSRILSPDWSWCYSTLSDCISLC